MSKYELMDPRNPLRALETQLERFENHDISRRVTILRDDVREGIEKVYGSTIEEDQDRFLDWVKRLLEARLGDAALPLTEGQIKRLQAEALHRSRPVHQLLQEKLKWAVTHALGY